ncbi:sialate O-acetylesterase [Bifidobacterium choloepi]|uniref:Sialate O-acetylesterase n=1 Tax=Bifidobacterium choloepi TaxID=2614131 RepID=A0A6I5NAQ2_9BIFI|nr:sialate O-acetylesterase [Bifidobacterium choloepi]NEG69530.1 sialate O-acetylesterase [Bifidobacterium choloepi]
MRLSSLFADGCVLQQGVPVPVWGTGHPGKRFVVTVQGGSVEDVVSEDGHWRVEIGPLDAGGPFVLDVMVDGAVVAERVVYVGEVVICAGQSNMELPVSWVAADYPSMLRCDDPLLHQCKIGVAYDFDGPRDEPVSAPWTSYEGTARGDFTAVGAYVGLALRRWLGVPVGLINMTLGGSPVESWLDRPTVAAHPEFAELLATYSSTAEANRLSAESLEAQGEWRREEERRRRPADMLAWSAVRLPGDLAAQLPELSGFHGELLLRKRFTLPADRENWPTTTGLMRLSTMTDRDETAVNGVVVGSSGDRYCLRDYVVPAGVLRGGLNEITVRLSIDGDDARVALGKRMTLAVRGDESGCCCACGGDDMVIDLEGPWECAVLASMDESCPAEDFVRWKPTGLFNAMTAPVAGYAARAVLWYQGESNTGEPTSRIYGELLADLTTLWRREWGQSRLPFVVVQLPELAIDVADDGGWPAVRDAQWKASLTLDDVATVVTLGRGDPYDLHPVNKQDVAALVFEVLRDLAYGDNHGRPMPYAYGAELATTADGEWQLIVKFAEVTFRGGRRTVNSFAGTLTSLDGCGRCELMVSYADHQSRHVSASVAGDSLHVRWHDDGAEAPVEVAYNWINNPHDNLVASQDGMIVPPFRLSIP